MEAIIRDGGRQLKVSAGQVVSIDYRDVEAGADVEFTEVLYVGEPGGGEGMGGEGMGGGGRVGTPLVAGAKVTAKVLGTVKGPKLIVTNFRRRKGSRRRVGHRQSYTQVQIDSIDA